MANSRKWKFIIIYNIIIIKNWLISVTYYSHLYIHVLACMHAQSISTVP